MCRGKKANWFEKVKVGDKFGKLTITELPEKLIGHTKIHCQCECGKNTQVDLIYLLSGNTRSCGCLSNASRSKSRSSNYIFHGKDYHRIVKNFYNMHARCNGKYKSLGRTVCDEWSYTEGLNNFIQWFLSELSRLNVSLEEFNDMPKYNGLTVDRKNNNLGYSPENCRLATMREQERNRGNSYKFCGKHILDYADELGIPYKLAYDYFYRKEFGKLLDYYQEVDHHESYISIE